MENSIALSVSLKVPTNDEEILQYEGVIPSLALAVGAMAKLDGVLTIHEYEAFVTTADAMSSKTSNPLLLRVLMLKGVLDENISFSGILQKIKKDKKNCPQEDLNDLLFTIVPLLQCQGDQAMKLAREWASVLGTNEEFLKKITEQLPEESSKERGWFPKLFKSHNKLKEQVKQLSLLYQDQNLLG